MDNLTRLNEHRKRDKEKSKTKFQDLSKSRLKKIIDTKLQTSFIGAIAKFEKCFGRIWGYGKTGELTANESQWKKIWEECRKEILDNGNNQKRALSMEIEQYNIEWLKYQFKWGN